MGLTQATKKQKIVAAIMASCLSAVVACVPTLAATTTKPYFKTYGADVFSGGWFNSGTSCDMSTTSSRYQDSSYSSSDFPPDDRSGGILSFARQDAAGHSAGGASSQYGAFSLGIIEGSASTDPASWGFYSAGAQAATGTFTPRNLLSFANDGNSASVWGGKFVWTYRTLSHCIPDYYSKKPASAQPTDSLNAAVSPPTPGGVFGGLRTKCTTNTYCLTTSDVTIPVGSKTTIYVEGNVYIDHKIVYELKKVDDVPKFALVVKGSIYIDSSVAQLDGLYIAQPASNSVSADDGDIWTCHANNTNPLLYTDLGDCNKQLVINGALVAKQVNFTRTKGDVTSASSVEDNLSTVATCTATPDSCNIAEIINYTPTMVTGGPFFNPPPPSGLPIDSLIALPPVF